MTTQEKLHQTAIAEYVTTRHRCGIISHATFAAVQRAHAIGVSDDALDAAWAARFFTPAAPNSTVSPT